MENFNIQAETKGHNCKVSGLTTELIIKKIGDFDYERLDTKIFEIANYRHFAENGIIKVEVLKAQNNDRGQTPEV